jgi:hypothetical protein
MLQETVELVQPAAVAVPEVLAAAAADLVVQPPLGIPQRP